MGLGVVVLVFYGAGDYTQGLRHGRQVGKYFTVSYISAQKLSTTAMFTHSTLLIEGLHKATLYFKYNTHNATIKIMMWVLVWERVTHKIMFTVNFR